MPPDRRVLRDIRDAYEGMKQYQLDAGQWCYWFRFDKADTTSHPVYDIGPERVWYPPVILPLLTGEYTRATQNMDDDGLYLIDHVHCVVSYDAFFHTMMIDPDPQGQNHLNDRVAFDGTLFNVDSFIPRGRIGSYFLTISIELAEVAEEDMVEDVANAMFSPYLDAS